MSIVESVAPAMVTDNMFAVRRTSTSKALPGAACLAISASFCCLEP